MGQEGSMGQFTPCPFLATCLAVVINYYLLSYFYNNLTKFADDSLVRLRHADESALKWLIETAKTAVTK